MREGDKIRVVYVLLRFKGKWEILSKDKKLAHVHIEKLDDDLKLGKRPTTDLPSVGFLPRVFPGTLGKGRVCRVPDEIHSAKSFALGKIAAVVISSFSSHIITHIYSLYN